ncbi:MAG: hypothetical protein C4K47_01710 [Candidatus Thorarchaeota archaeon]|nr:MAG: hypothetical protein C4K47_01710 [Candidatus Thorarchaeota archaeon]
MVGNKDEDSQPVQTTLGELIESKKSGMQKMKSAKSSTRARKHNNARANDKKSTKKGQSAKATKKQSSKVAPSKSPRPKHPASKPAKEKKEEPKQKTGTERTPSVPSQEGTALKLLPGVGAKLAQKLASTGYDSVERLSKARADALSRRIKGLNVEEAKKIIRTATEYLRGRSVTDETLSVEAATPVSGAALLAAEDSAAETATAKSDEEGSKTKEYDIKLTELPGVGPKLAERFREAGYDSVARVSRSRPDALARTVAGLSKDRAKSIVSAAKEAITSRQLAELAEEASKTAPEPKRGAAAPPTKKRGKAKTQETVVSPLLQKAKAKKPIEKRPRPVIKSSGLPVPESVLELRRELKARYRAAEKAEAAAGSEAPAFASGTVQVADLTSDETTARLVEAAIEVLNETMTTGRPSFEIPSRSADNIVWDEIKDLLLLGMRTISRPYHSLASVLDATRTARVMEIVYQLLRSGLHATKRELYYADVNLFRDQRYSDKIIEDVASMLPTTRDSIHVVAAARGSAMGRIVIRDAGDRIDLTQMGTGGWAITPFLDQVEIVESDAEFILLSEKDAAVMRLAEAKYWNRQPCIVITGKGSGDIATRAFLKTMVKELEIPAFALMDSDPYGHYIYSVFLRGSKRLSYESPFIATPELKLLGVLSRDLDEFKIPKSVRIPMMPADIKRVKEMLKEPFVQKNDPWVEDLQLMLRIKEKAEIQAFASHGFEYLTDEYIPRKLETGDWI